jgi:signal transduction histidine kinase
MPTTSAQIIQTIVISTLLLLLVGFMLIRYIFIFQRRRYRHSQELLELREVFNQTLLQSKLEIQEHTLDHIAKELHANFSHLVSLININLAEILPQSSPKMRENVLETKSLAKQLLSELKALSASLNTDHIMHIGFVKALDNELKRIVNTKRYQVTFSKTGQEYRLPPEHEIILFRLCQEILNNTIKYANATSISATLNYAPDLFTLEIYDNGSGFDINRAIDKRGENESTGLMNIQTRAKLINGVVDIESQVNNGTKFTISIPKIKSHAS